VRGFKGVAGGRENTSRRIPSPRIGESGRAGADGFRGARLRKGALIRRIWRVRCLNPSKKARRSMFEDLTEGNVKKTKEEVAPCGGGYRRRTRSSYKQSSLGGCNIEAMGRLTRGFRGGVSPSVEMGPVNTHKVQTTGDRSGNRVSGVQGTVSQKRRGSSQGQRVGRGEKFP